MASIEQRKTDNGDISYRVKVRLKGFPTQTATFKRKTDANRWAQQTETAIREGRYFNTSEAKRHTLQELLKRYKSDILDQHPKKKRDQTRHIDWWKDELGEYCLAEITPQLLSEYRDKLSKGITPKGTQRSPATVNRYLAALSHAFSIAANEWGWIENNPVLKVRKLTEPRGRVRFLSDDERTNLLTACEKHSHQLYTIVALALSTGARQGEILNLTWDNVDLTRGMIILEHTKNDERRAIPLQGHALELFKDMSKVRQINTRLLFPSRINPNKPLNIQKIWESAVKNAEIDDFRFHDLRHSAASYLAMNGATTGEIAEILGHKTLQMVKRYSHLTEQHTSKVVAKMNEQIFS